MSRTSAPCSQYRESISAAVDGEPGGLPESELEAHLDGCPGCSAWYADTLSISRHLRLRDSDEVPDLTEPILRAALAARQEPPFAALVARAGLVAVALVQLALALPVLIGGADSTGGMMASMHMAHESGAWNLGLGIAFLTAAVRPRAAAALLPTVGVLASTFLFITVRDLAAGRVTVERGVTHVLMVVGTGLLVALFLHTRTHRGTRRHRSAGVRRIAISLGGRPRTHP